MRDPHSELLNALAPVFFAIILGYFAGRTGTIDNKNVEELNSLVMTFAVPASIFVSIAQATRRELWAQVPLALILSSTMLILYGFTFWMAKSSFKADSSEASLQALTTSLPNYASAGLPLIMALLGPTRVISVAVAIGCGSIVVSPITLVILNHGTRKTEKGAATENGSSGILAALKGTLMKPIVLAPIIAVVLILAGVRLPEPIANSLSLIGEVSGGAGLFLTGVILSAQRWIGDGTSAFRRCFRTWYIRSWR
jgi:malonate transporter